MVFFFFFFKKKKKKKNIQLVYKNIFYINHIYHFFIYIKIKYQYIYKKILLIILHIPYLIVTQIYNIRY